MKKYLFILFTVFCTSLNSQTLKILDAATKEPIPFATVLLKQGDSVVFGNYCEEDGSIIIDNSKLFDTAEVSCVGYTTATFSKVNFKDEIYLSKSIIKLDEVLINKVLAKPVVLGNVNAKTEHVIGLGKGLEEVILIENSADKPLVIQAFLFKIQKTKGKIALRLHFYKKRNRFNVKIWDSNINRIVDNYEMEEYINASFALKIIDYKE